VEVEKKKMADERRQEEMTGGWGTNGRSARKEKGMISQQQLKALLQEQKIGLSAPEVLIELPEGPIFHVLIEGHSRVLDQWQQARGLVGTTSLYPVIVASKEAMITEILERPPGSTEIRMAEIVRQAREMDAMQVLAHYLCSPGDEYGKVSVEVFSATDPGIYLPWVEEILGAWPESVDLKEFSRSSECLEFPEAREIVSLCLLPVEQSWQVPALLRFGGWNDCPFPAEHTCVHLSWHNRYGAEIIRLSRDTMELFVPYPPTTLQECRSLALEHFAYSPDTIYSALSSPEGLELKDLVISLLRYWFWFFWWD
jgi:hypothetical protein